MVVVIQRPGRSLGLVGSFAKVGGNVATSSGLHPVPGSKALPVRGKVDKGDNAAVHPPGRSLGAVGMVSQVRQGSGLQEYRRQKGRGVLNNPWRTQLVGNVRYPPGRRLGQQLVRTCEIGAKTTGQSAVGELLPGQVPHTSGLQLVPVVKSPRDVKTSETDGRINRA